MKKLFAVPTENGALCAHFGHCEKFAIIETEDQKIIGENYLAPPAHEPGVAWDREHSSFLHRIILKCALA